MYVTDKEVAAIAQLEKIVKNSLTNVDNVDLPSLLKVTEGLNTKIQHQKVRRDLRNEKKKAKRQRNKKH